MHVLIFAKNLLMKTCKISLSFTLLLWIIALAPLTLLANENATILGKWYTTDNAGIVEIYDCDGKLCGKITWLDEPYEEDGSEKTDINNPDEKNHDRPIIGMDILHGFEKTDDNKWEDGKIYHPENGKTYSCKMTLEGDELNVRGFIGFSLLGRTEVWKRVK